MNKFLSYPPNEGKTNLRLTRMWFEKDAEVKHSVLGVM